MAGLAGHTPAEVASTAIRGFRRNKANQHCQILVRPVIVKKKARDRAPEYHQFRLYSAITLRFSDGPYESNFLKLAGTLTFYG
jgi:hypothetical protein